MKTLKSLASILIHLAAFALLLVAVEPWLPENRVLAAVIGLVAYNALCLHSIYTRLLTYRRPEATEFRKISKG